MHIHLAKGYKSLGRRFESYRAHNKINDIYNTYHSLPQAVCNSCVIMHAKRASLWICNAGPACPLQPEYAHRSDNCI
jgi:hypothetical protein